MTNHDFCELWNRSNSIAEVIAVTRQSKQGAAVKASRLRKIGLELKVMPRPTSPISGRFWEKVKKTRKCWEWQGSLSKKGYGQIATKRGSRPLLTHRLSYEMHYGPIGDGLLVCHRCDNPKCVRPDHLFLGTPKQNTRDMMSKGRGWWQKEELSCS